MKGFDGKDIEYLSGFQWWKKKRRSFYFQNFLMILCILAVLCVGVYFIGIDTLEFNQIALVAVLFLALAGWCVFQAVQWVRSFRIEVEQVWYGTITDFRRNLKKNREVKNYRISAEVNGKVMEGICLTQTYYRAEVGQQIVFFSIGNDKIYCVHPEM